MGQQSSSVAEQYGLARVNRERRWTAIVDAVLVLVTLGWVAVLRLGASTGPGLRWGVSLLLLAMIVHRSLLLVERLRHRRRSRPVLVLGEVEQPPETRAA